jgi:chromosome segregation protein
MRLKSLEIKGFKSFGDKVTIHFDEGVTAIVGPNGSGKSNVVDAMRWVLGEQKTRMLRSEKMENIIFNGTKTRKPANLSEVSLTFENTKGVLPVEYSTVSITRRLYRSGESEYQLNGITCRLKDINDLFLDTGIGPDSYAIIELNMVDDILKDRNNTIKTLLEEAAGISKYKMRKKQTFQKLEETDADLNRVNDLLFEIEKSLKQLESQAKKTDRYYKLKEEYKTLSTQLALYSIQHHRERLAILKEKEQEHHLSKTQLQDRLENLELDLQEIKLGTSEKEKSLQQVQKLLNEKLLEITRYENEEKNRNERFNFLVEKQKQLQIQTEQDDKSLADVTVGIAQLNEEKIREEEHLKKLEEEILNHRNAAELSKKDYEQSLLTIKELNQQIYQLRSMINEFETKQAVRHTRFNAVNDELKRLHHQRSENTEKLETFSQQLNALLPQKEEADQELRKFKQIRLELEEQVKVSDSRTREINQVVQTESRKLDAKNNEYQLTKNLLEQMEGYPESIRYLKKNHDRFKQAPLLSEIIVCDDAYKVAIENFLEPYLNHFVVDTMEDAWAALDVLNESSKGRAHFFVLDSLKNYQSNSATQLSGCTLALDAIEKNDKYNQLFKLLLGHVFILEEGNNIHHFEVKDEQSLVVLSQNGNFLRQKYAIGGGSIGKFDGKRTGKFRNLEKLADEIKDQEKAIEELKVSLKNAEQEIQDLKNRIQENQQAISRQESDFMRLSGQVNSLQSNRDFMNNTLQQSQHNISKLEEEVSSIQRLMDEEKSNPDLSPEILNQRLENLIQQLNVQQEHSVQLQKESGEKSQAFNQQNILLLQQQNRIQNIVRDLGYKNNQSTTLQKNKENYALEIESVKAQTDQLMLGMESSSDAFKKLIEERVEFENNWKVSEAAYNEAKVKIEAEEKRLGDLRKNKELTDGTLQSVYDELNQLKLQMNSLQERLNIEFNIDIEELSSIDPDPEFNEEEMRPKAEQMRKRVNEFGPINPMALEQYKEIKERYDFIVKEKTDLQDAKDALLLTISEIDNSAQTVFMDAFTQVRTNFIRVFRSLFTEDDNCDLVISDPTNPLEADINIIAQPKGKKPLSIHQLSGGEKTLTATALLFGIYLLKPAPFCIFDEVDAPLDDNNIDKFNNIIKKFSDESQFIIITHNKKTMAATDIMYGITMAEPGVTSVVPVDMRTFAD